MLVLSRPSPADALIERLSGGGDARIALDPVTGLNRYMSAPYPRDVLAFASSTANDLSAEAWDYLSRSFPDAGEGLFGGEAYARCLDGLRCELRDAYALDPSVDVFFAPSGTDLEYVGLLAATGRGREGIANLLLGADEVGSGCIHSAAGRFFAEETALGLDVEPRARIDGLPPVSMDDLPVRAGLGAAQDSVAIGEAMERAVGAALAAGRFPLLHVVHGSKTGLVLPRLEHIDALRARFGERIGFVIDACQARITAAAVQAYLARGAIVFLTGSKFMGGPPFSGFALLPPGLSASAAPIAPGMAQVFRRAEVPAAWAGRECLSDSGNPGLALRLAAALFELARFQRLPIEPVAAVVGAFTAATDRLAADLGVRKVASVATRDARMPSEHPIEMQTLVTIDLCHSQDGARRRALDFAEATRIHRELAFAGVRLGQPVRCVRLDGGWGGTLRIGLSMPQVCRLDAIGVPARESWLADAMGRIAQGLRERLDRPGGA
jgi:hypothetical protein